MSYQNPIELYVIIEQIVDSIRSTGSVSAYSEVNGTYTITSDNTLVNNDWITINSIQYKVTDVSETGFTIKGETGLNFTNAEWKANAPYFMCEKEPKAGNILTEKTKQDTYKWQKYPLFLLTRPYTDDRSNRMIGYSTDFSLHIITDTESTYWSDDRIDNNFTPTLYPLYNAFMNALPLNRWVKEKYLEKINHSKTDSMFIDANPFPDKMDGLTIDFTDLEILKNRQICGIDTPQIYTVDLSSTTGGEAISSLGSEGVYNNVAKDSNEAFNATAESGSRFVRWLLNGVENLTNPLALIIKKNYTIVAEFIQSFTLTTSAVGNGTITPLSGDYDSGSEVTITATPNDPQTDVLDRIEKNNVVVSNTSPYQFVINELSNVVAYFVALLQTVQDVFTTKSIQIGKNWAFENQIGASPTKNYNLIFALDSLTASILCDSSINYPQEVAKYLNDNSDFDIKYKNSGIGGENIVQYDINFDENIGKYKSEDRNNLLVIFGFANTGGYTAQEQNDAMESIVSKCHNIGIDTLVMTSPGNLNATVQANIQAANAILRNNNTYSDYFHDLGANADLYDLGGGSLTCDGSHLTNDGKVIQISEVSNYIINNIIPTYTCGDCVKILNTKHFKISDTTEKAEAAKTTSLDLSTNNFTIYARVKISVDGTKIIVDRGATNEYMMILYENIIMLVVNGSVRQAAIHGETTLNRIVDVCIRRNGNLLEFLVDGQRLNDTGIPSDTDLSSANPITLPAYLITPSYNSIDYYDLMIFNNRILTDEEVYKLYVNESIDLTNCSIRPDFNFGLGDVIPDKSGNGNTFNITSSNPDGMWIDGNEQPNYYTKGGTLLTRDLDGKTAIATYNNNGVPNLAVLSGFTKVGDFAAGSGILKGLENTYLGVKNNPTIEQDFNTLDAIPNSSTYIKTKPTDNNISRLIIKE